MSTTHDDMNGLYIHRQDDHHPTGMRTMTTIVGHKTQEWVHADDFMAVQKNRDDLRREMAIINAMVCAAKPDREFRQYVIRAVSRMGFTANDAAAMMAIITEFGPKGGSRC